MDETIKIKKIRYISELYKYKNLLFINESRLLDTSNYVFPYI